MMRNILAIALLGSLLCPACDPAKEPNGFDVYLKQLPKQELPLSGVCYNEVPWKKNQISDSLIAIYGRESSRVAGLLWETERYTAVLYLYPADVELPIIYTTDRNGKKIDSLQMYDSWCGDFETGYGCSWFEIGADHSIMLRDSFSEQSARDNSVYISRINAIGYEADSSGHFNRTFIAESF